jgi:hypothetical protein
MIEVMNFIIYTYYFYFYIFLGGTPRSSESSNAGFQTPFIRIPLRGIPDPLSLSVIPVFIPSFITGIFD